MPKIVNAKNSKVKLNAGVDAGTNQDINFGGNAPTLFHTVNAVNLYGRDHTIAVSTGTSAVSILQPSTSTVDMGAAGHSTMFYNDLVKIDTDCKSELFTHHKQAACFDIYDNTTLGTIVVPRGMNATINTGGVLHVLQATNDCDLVVKLGDLPSFASDHQS